MADNAPRGSAIDDLIGGLDRELGGHDVGGDARIGESDRAIDEQGRGSIRGFGP